MSWFEYKAITRGGTLMAGQLEALHREGAQNELTRMGLEVRELNDTAAPPAARAELSSEDLIFFNEQLASLAEAGIALDDGLAQLARDVESPRLRRWILDIVEDVRRGVALDDAVAQREKGLPVLYSRVIRAGIDSGELPATLLNLNHHLRFIGTTRRIVWETASYPLLVAALAVVIVSFFFLALMPQFEEIYRDFDTQLPGLTVLLIWIAHSYWAILLALAVAVVGGGALWHTLRYSRTGRTIRESVLAVIPVIGRVHRASLLARFLRAVSTTVAAGITLPEALRLGAGATGNEPLMTDAEHLAGEVERGNSVFVANQSARMIPPLFGFCVQTAMGRGTLPQALDRLAHAYEARAMHGQSLLRSVLFPVLIILLGGILGCCIVGLFLPLIHLINSMSGG